MPATQPTLVFETILDAGLIISCQTTSSPSDAEWNAYLIATKALLQAHPKPRFLVLTEGGHPSREQQNRTKAELGKRSIPVAIVSKASVARFVASVMALFNPLIQCYSPEQRLQAYDHLGLDEAQRKMASSVVERLTRKLSPRTVAASPQP